MKKIEEIEKLIIVVDMINGKKKLVSFGIM